jgi:Membrane-bound toxin component of toxin-antitoxin system
LLKPYATPLRLEPGRSVLLGGWLLVSHAGVAVLLPWLPLPPSVQLALGVLLLVDLLWYWRCQVVRTARGALRSLTWQDGRSCRVQLAGGAEFEATLEPRAFVQPWLVILQLRTDRWHRHHLLLLPDMLDAVTLRQLRVRLRMELSNAS